MSSEERRLDKLEEELDGKAPPEDETGSPLGKKLEDHPALREAYKQVWRAQKREEEPNEDYMKLLQQANQKASMEDILANNSELKEIYKKSAKARAILGEEIPPEDRETLQKSEQIEAKEEVKNDK